MLVCDFVLGFVDLTSSIVQHFKISQTFDEFSCTLDNQLGFCIYFVRKSKALADHSFGFCLVYHSKTQISIAAHVFHQKVKFTVGDQFRNPQCSTDFPIC